MAIELSTELIGLQQAADAAHAHLLDVQKRLGTRERLDGTQEVIPTAEWTEEQHAEWQAAWEAWRKAAEEVQAAVAESEERLTVETELKRRVRHPEPEAA
ncbi:hypothetical protein [Streptomyces formicae]